MMKEIQKFMKNKKMTKNNEKSSKKAKFSGVFTKISSFIDKYLFPDDIKCIFCGRDIPDFYNKPFCEDCENFMEFNKGNRCKICDIPIKNETVVCDFCQNNKRFFKKAYCPLIYKDKIRQTILNYKFNNKRYLAKGFAVIMAKYLKDLQIDIITFVPMTKVKQKDRSFNQSERLANELGKILDISVIPTLEKIKETDAQKTLTFQERSENLKDAFRVINKDEIKGKRVLLVDDILTTCATVNTCSEYLAKHCTIFVTTIARNCLI